MRPAPYNPPLAVAVIDKDILGGALVVTLSKCIYVSPNGKTWRGCAKDMSALRGIDTVALHKITSPIKTPPFRLVLTKEVKDFLDFSTTKATTPETPCASSSSPS